MHKKFVAVAAVLFLLLSFASSAFAAREIHYSTWASSGEAAYTGMEKFKGFSIPRISLVRQRSSLSRSKWGRFT